MTSEGFFVDVLTSPLDTLGAASSLQLKDYGALVIVDPEAARCPASPLHCTCQQGLGMAYLRFCCVL